jgi:pimeloyl-ACP methyl ester carboxylesterase
MLLPGMMCSAQLFRHQIAQFSFERAVQFSPLLGHADVSSFAAEVLQNAPGEFALCGLSMGGGVAMEVQRQAPMRIRGLALLDTNPLAEIFSVKQARKLQIEKVADGQADGQKNPEPLTVKCEVMCCSQRAQRPKRVD